MRGARAAIAAVLCIPFVATCGGGSKEPGTEGGLCREDSTCDESLECIDMVCVRTCGDGVCAGGETHEVCPEDCPLIGCGNEILERDELCDGSNLDGWTCELLDPVHYSGGLLACDDACLLDTSGCVEQDVVTLEGVVWSPGADRADTPEVSRFPVPGALVAAYPAGATAEPELQCDSVPLGIPHTYADPVDGSFSLPLAAGTTYQLAVQKGLFWRTREIVTPQTPDAVFVLGAHAPGYPRPPETTLPTRLDETLGDRIPSIAILPCYFEWIENAFVALGFDPTADLTIIGLSADHNVDRGAIEGFLHHTGIMGGFDVIVSASDEHWPGTQTATDNLRDWVREGGVLWADDGTYDYVEQPWPTFLTFYNMEMDIGPEAGICGDGALPPSDPYVCNNWSGAYVGTMIAEDPHLAAWLTLTANPIDEPLYWHSFWDAIHEVHEGPVGEDDQGAPLLEEPKIWLRFDGETPAGTDRPVLVSWPYYAGRVIFSILFASPTDTPNRELGYHERLFFYQLLGGTDC